MVICCAAANCSNRQGKGDKRAVSFHRFPLKDSKRLLQWLKAVQRENWTPTKYSFLCSEHFTKDSFSKRLEDQHRLLKPTAVPSIFHLAEKGEPGAHGRARRRDPRKAAGGLRGEAAGAAGAPSGSPMAKAEPHRGKRTSRQGETTGQEQPAPMEAPGPGSKDNPEAGTEAAPGSQEEAGVSPQDSAAATAAAGELEDRGGVSVDDFTPPGSGACKFIGSLHSYSFSSRHARERPALPREPVDRKRPRRDVADRVPAPSPPGSSLPATPQKPPQSPSAPPADVPPKPAAEAVQSERSDASPMSINEVILSASGACRLIDSLHSYCFSSRQSKSQVCCLREQVEKKSGELRSLRQRVSRSDGRVRKLQAKLDALRRASLPFLGGLLPPSRAWVRRSLGKVPTMHPSRLGECAAGFKTNCQPEILSFPHLPPHLFFFNQSTLQLWVIGLNLGLQSLRAPQDEPGGGAAVLDAGDLAVGPAGRRRLPHAAALPVPGGGPHLPRGPAHAQLLVQCLPPRHAQAPAPGVRLHPPQARHQQGGLHQRPEHRHRGSGRRRGERAGAEHRLSVHRQDLILQGAPRGADHSQVPAEFRRQTGADGLHGNHHPAADAAPSHHLPEGDPVTRRHGHCCVGWVCPRLPATQAPVTAEKNQIKGLYFYGWALIWGAPCGPGW
ncbi:peroxynitrite isomerase THAP4 isoform X1 [Erinaceus europaeus]|uniref:Peroxynitrite isomerase THAP4 isoform X1 n=1 Tax=Erinaceus europaeus TaxID=9365 RepID=A0ABM3XLA1_ERIEU|nr:peroxynitrite isomerase THAP4 isoform X1 [Erinaceus europaeus]